MILDEFSALEQAPTPYLKKSAIVLVICWSFFALLIAAALLPETLWGSGLDSRYILVGLLFFIAAISAPFGLFFIWKSFRRKEGSIQTRYAHLIGHAIFCMFIIILIFSIANDL